MYLSLHRIQHFFPARKLCGMGLVCFFVVGGIVSVQAGTFFSGYLPLWLTQAQEKAGKSVKGQADYYFQLARKYIRAGEVEKGKTLLQQVLTLDPQNSKAKNELQKLTDSGVSIAPSTPLIAAADASGKSKTAEAKTDAKKSAAPAVKKVDSPSGEKPLQTMESMTATEMMNAAKAMMRDGDYVSAQTTLEATLKKSKDDKEKRQIRAYLGAIGKEQEKKDKALESQIDFNLTELDRQIQKGAIYLEKGDLDKAEVEFHRAQQIAPGDKRVAKYLDQINKARGTAQSSESALKNKAEKAQKSEAKTAADSLFREGVELYKQGLIIEAVDKWKQSVQVYPEHQTAQTYLTNTQMEYEQAVEAKQKAEKMAAEDAKYEKMLDTEIAQYSTQGELIDIKDVMSTLSAFSELNIMMDENLKGNVSFEVKSTTLRGILNLLQKQYGFQWRREDNTIFFKRGFETRIFPLNEGQFKTIEAILNDPSVLQDSSKNLKSILYGPSEEFNVPGKQLFLNKITRSLVITDTEDNLRKVEAFLKEMPAIVGEKKPVETKTYKLVKDVAKEYFNLIKLMLYEGKGAYDITDTRRQLLLEPNSNTLIVIDYPENIAKVEGFLSDQQVQQRLEEGELMAKQFRIADIDDTGNPQEYTQGIAEVLSAMLYGKSKEAAILQGRQMFTNPEKGTIDVVDTRQNIRRVEDYLASARSRSNQDIIIRSFPIQHVDVFTIADALGYLFFDTQQSTRPLYLSQNNVQSIGTDETGASTSGNITNVYEQGNRTRFNLTGGGGGGQQLLQYFDIRFYPDTNTNSIVVFTTNPEVLDIAQEVMSTFDQPQRMIEIETRFVTVSLADLRSINFDYLLTNPLLEPINVDARNQDMSVNLNRGDINVDKNPGVELNIHTFGESRLDFLLNLLESTSSLNTLAAPKVLSIPNPAEPPLIFIGQQIPYAQSVQFEDTGNSYLPPRMSVQFQRAAAGVALAVIPFILNDDYIYLELGPNITEPGERLPVQVTGGATASSAQQTVPSVGPLLFKQKYIRTSVRLKNGGSIVLGGLIDETNTEKVSKVPIISKIPFLGSLFTDRSIEKVKNSTLIFVTARIVEPGS